MQWKCFSIQYQTSPLFTYTFSPLPFSYKTFLYPELIPIALHVLIPQKSLQVTTSKKLFGFGMPMDVLPHALLLMTILIHGPSPLSTSMSLRHPSTALNPDLGRAEPLMHTTWVLLTNQTHNVQVTKPFMMRQRPGRVGRKVKYAKNTKA